MLVAQETKDPVIHPRETLALASCSHPLHSSGHHFTNFILSLLTLMSPSILEMSPWLNLSCAKQILTTSFEQCLTPTVDISFLVLSYWNFYSHYFHFLISLPFLKSIKPQFLPLPVLGDVPSKMHGGLLAPAEITSPIF